MKYEMKPGKKNEFGTDYVLFLEIQWYEQANFGNVLMFIWFFFFNEDNIYPKHLGFAGRTKLFNAIEALYNGISIEVILKIHELPSDVKPIRFTFTQEKDESIKLNMNVEWGELITFPGLFEILTKYFKTKDREKCFEAIRRLHIGTSIADIVKYCQVPRWEQMVCVSGIEIPTESDKGQASLNEWF